MSKNYDGEPLDLAWQSDLKDVGTEREGETVAGSDGELDGSEHSEFWPSILPRKAFEGPTSKQADVIEKYVQFPEADKEKIADTVGCHINTVRRALNKASLFAAPHEVPFGIPGRPQSHKRYIETYTGHPKSRFDAEDLYSDSEVEAISESETANGIDADEVARRYYEEESEEAERIAEDLGISKSAVWGYLGNADYDPSESSDSGSQEPDPDEEFEQVEVVEQEFEHTETEAEETKNLNRPVAAAGLIALAIWAFVRLISGGNA